MLFGIEIISAGVLFGMLQFSHDAGSVPEGERFDVDCGENQEGSEEICLNENVSFDLFLLLLR